MELFLESLLEVLIDTAKLLPFLFVTYLVMEYFEHKTESRSLGFMKKVGPFGPLFGGAAGILPQCGFSAASAGLYSGGLITVGTLLAVFLSTSDEMLPIMISQAVRVPLILKILFAKMAIGVCTGFFVDAMLRLRARVRAARGLSLIKREKDFHEQCERDDCHCEEGNIFKSALIHTLKIAIFLFIVSLAIELLVQFAGEEAIGAFLTNSPVIGVLLAGLVGLIPNCVSSVTITQLYLRGLLGAGQMMAGLLVAAGVGLLVLFRGNRDLKENLKITGALYAAGVLWGLLISLLVG